MFIETNNGVKQMFGIAYNPKAEAAQLRKEAKCFFFAFRAANDIELKAIYKSQFKASLKLAKSLERLT